MENAGHVVLTDVEKRLLRILKWCNILVALSGILIFVLLLLPGPMEQVPTIVIFAASLPSIAAFSLRGCISGFYLVDAKISPNLQSEFKAFFNVMPGFAFFGFMWCVFGFFAHKPLDVLRNLPISLSPFIGLVFFFLGRFIGRRRNPTYRSSHSV